RPDHPDQGLFGPEVRAADRVGDVPEHRAVLPWFRDDHAPDPGRRPLRTPPWKVGRIANPSYWPLLFGPATPGPRANARGPFSWARETPEGGAEIRPEKPTDPLLCPQLLVFW